MTTYIAKCRRCKSVTSTVAYRVNRVDADMGALVIDRTGESGLIGGFAIACRGCGKLASAKAVRGRLSLDHKCGPRCESSVGHDCTCSCGGKNHGRAFAA